MRIGIEAWAAADVPAGRGRYLRELLRALAALRPPHEIVLFARARWEEGGLPFEWRLGPVRPWSVARAARDCDALLAPTSYLACALSPVPSIGVVFDLVAFDRALGAPRGAALERLTLPLAGRRARALLCISQATRDELVRRFPRASDRAIVTPLAAGPGFAGAVADPAVLARHGLERPYVLSAATLEPRKNLPRLIEAFRSLPAAIRDTTDLALVGARGWRTGELDAALARHGPDVRALGFLSDQDLAALYAGAAAVAYPSLAEGFGLPVIEAMAAGAPVLTSSTSSLPEVAGDAALLVDPRDTGAIRDGLAALLTDEALRERLRTAGPQRAAEFSWERTARATLDAIERAT